MTNPTINLKGLIILIADSSSYVRMISHSMLRGFGANKVLEVGQTTGAAADAVAQKIDILLCDARLPPHGGLVLTRTIRRNADNVNRTMPILLMSSDTRETTIKSARDAGANMVIAKPMSPKNLYDRLAWIAFSSRNFVDTETYFGPDRRFKIEGYPGGVGRRKGDGAIEVARRSDRRSRKTISTAFSAPPVPDSPMAEQSEPRPQYFPVDTRFQQLARRPGGVTRERAIESAQRHIEELKTDFGDWLDRELQELSVDPTRLVTPIRADAIRAGAGASSLLPAAGRRRHHGLRACHVRREQLLPRTRCDQGRRGL